MTAFGPPGEPGPLPGPPPALPPKAMPPPMPPPLGTPPRPRRRRLRTAGLVLAVLVAFGVVGVLRADDPETVTRKYWSALLDGDRKQAAKYVCPRSRSAQNAGFDSLVDSMTGFAIGPGTGAGGLRRVPVTVHLRVGGETGDATILTIVTRKLGKWHVCGLELG